VKQDWVVFQPFLSQAGRLELTNVVFTSLPTYYMCTFALPKTVIKTIDSFRKHCLWRGNDINDRKPPKAAWKLVTKPKEEGGLGVIDIEKQNEALLLKNLNKFFNKQDIPWVHLVWEKHYKNGKLPGHVRKGSYWWRDILKLLPSFKEMARVEMKNGSSILFWQDNWNTQDLKTLTPELYSFAKNKYIAAHKVSEQSDFTQLLHLPISEEAFEQMQHILLVLGNITPTENKDIWRFSWGANFSSSQAYRQLVGHQQVHIVYRWLWQCLCQPKHKVFFWLLIKDRLSTRNILKRKNMFLDSYNCVLCLQNTEETYQHLFLHCPFAQQCWNLIHIDIPLNEDFPEVTEFFNDRLQS
jgi:hypothetical protein